MENTVQAVLLTVSGGRLMILLEEDEDEKDTYRLPGTVDHEDEDLDRALERLLSAYADRPENYYFCQIYTFGAAARVSSQRSIATVYLCLVPEHSVQDASGRWFALSRNLVESGTKLQRSLLAMECEGVRISYEISVRPARNYTVKDSVLTEDASAKIADDGIKAVNMALDILRNRSMSTGILFNLLPEEVTLRQIQTAYEAVNGRKTDTGNFRRDIKKMLRMSENVTKSKGRDTQLYRFDPMFQYLEENL